jgi:hypothetical protein
MTFGLNLDAKNRESRSELAKAFPSGLTMRWLQLSVVKALSAYERRSLMGEKPELKLEATKPLKATGSPSLFNSTCSGRNIPKVSLGQGPFRSAVG